MHPYVRLLCGCRILSYLYQLCSLQAIPGVAVLQAAPEASEMAVESKAPILTADEDPEPRDQLRRVLELWS